MRICLFSMMLPVHYIGGMEMHAWELAKGLKKHGNDVTIITGRHPDNIEFEEKEGIKIYYVGKEKANSNYPLSYWNQSPIKFVELNDIKKFDIVHSESAAAWGFIRKNLGRKYSIPVVATMHGTTLGEIKSVLNKPKSFKSILIVAFHIFSYITIGLKFVRSLDAVIAVSTMVRDETIKGFFVKKEKIFVVWNGIDTEKYMPCNKLDAIKERYGIKNEKIILALGRLEQEKGTQFAIHALPRIIKEIQDVKLVIVGSGKYLNELKYLAYKLNIERNVIFSGNISDSEILMHYNLADVFITPTIRVEGLPLVIAEAMACGKPVIASNIGGIPDMVEEGVNGFLIPPGDVKALEEKILEILSNKELANKLGANARRTVLERFDINKMMGKTVKVYNEVLHGKR